MQERIKLRELLPHIGPFPIVIPLSYFRSYWFSAAKETSFPPEDDIFSRVAWKFRGGAKVQKHVRRARVLFNAKQERIKRIYPLLMRNENSF